MAKYLKVTLYYDNSPQGSFTQPLDEIDFAAFFGELDAECGESYRVEAVEMTPEQYEALPEFKGF